VFFENFLQYVIENNFRKGNYFKNYGI